MEGWQIKRRHLCRVLSYAAAEPFDACKLNNREQPSLPQFEALPLLLLIRVLVIDAMQPGPRVRDYELADQILHRQRRKMRPHCSAQVVKPPVGNAAQPVDSLLRFREAVDGLCAASS